MTPLRKRFRKLDLSHFISSGTEPKTVAVRAMGVPVALPIIAPPPSRPDES